GVALLHEGQTRYVSPSTLSCSPSRALCPDLRDRRGRRGPAWERESGTCIPYRCCPLVNVRGSHHAHLKTRDFPKKVDITPTLSRCSERKNRLPSAICLTASRMLQGRVVTWNRFASSVSITSACSLL